MADVIERMRLELVCHDLATQNCDLRPMSVATPPPHVPAGIVWRFWLPVILTVCIVCALTLTVGSLISRRKSRRRCLAACPTEG